MAISAASYWQVVIAICTNPAAASSALAVAATNLSKCVSLARVAGELGFEPRLTESESAVLPLNYSPIPSRPYSWRLIYRRKLSTEEGRGPLRLAVNYVANLFFSCQ